MANFMFSSLPDEILASVAEQCDQGDLFNLCLVSKRMYEGCNRVLYRHVDLEGKLPGSHVVLTEQSEDYHRTHDAIMKEQSFVLTLEEHPEYGKYVRSYKGVLCEDMRFVNYSLRHVRSVEIGSRTNNATETPGPLGRTIADNLFQSATSVTLVGCLDYNLAKSILNAIDPTMLEHLCLNMVQDHAIEHLTPGHMPGDTSEDGRIVAYGATSGLLRPLTGRCTALRTLTLRRVGQINVTHEWDAGAEDASYTELASFIDSVRSSLVRFTYEQSGQWRRRAIPARANTSNRIMDHQFRHIILPAFVSANWPRLASIELQGVRTRDGGAAGLTLELRAVVKENTKIEIKERPVSHVREFWHIVERYES
ncbi:hypothetical protein MMC07_000635 [Pseudocyphellaria aurata]|nr:hypothetical protein [Pseudocyphellaria aurata]